MSLFGDHSPAGGAFFQFSWGRAPRQDQGYDYPYGPQQKTEKKGKATASSLRLSDKSGDESHEEPQKQIAHYGCRLNLRTRQVKR